MKQRIKIFAGVFFLIAIISAQAVVPGTLAVPRIVFENYSYDFGTIKRHADGTCSFVFRNDGNSPLLITKVTAACGCTVPEYPKSPILPGQKAEIKVKYNTKTVGAFSKTINVSTNDPKNSTVVLTIKGNVTR